MGKAMSVMGKAMSVMGNISPYAHTSRCSFPSTLMHRMSVKTKLRAYREGRRASEKHISRVAWEILTNLWEEALGENPGIESFPRLCLSQGKFINDVQI